MSILFLQLVFLFVIFVSVFGFLLLPLWIFSKNRTTHNEEWSQRIIALCNSFSTGIFFGVCFLGLFPYVDDQFDIIWKKIGTKVEYPFAQLIIICGFFLLLFIDVCMFSCMHRHDYESMPENLDDETHQNESQIEVSPPSSTCSMDDNLIRKDISKTNLENANYNTADTVELSHQHEDNDNHHGHSHAAVFMNDLSNIHSFLMMAALGLHSFFEGMALGLQNEEAKAVNIFIGVLMHEVIISFAVGINLKQKNIPISRIVKVGILFSLSIPIGLSLGLTINIFHSLVAEIISGIIQALATGTFIYVIFFEMMPNEINSADDKPLRSVLLFFGFIFMAVVQYFLD